MTALEEEAAPIGLLLAGYVALCETGFALPCYATGPQANVWNVAVCSPDGDHTGTVVGFDVFEGEGVVILPEELRRRVIIGSAWQDVFLWNGTPFVGTPKLLFERLRPEMELLAARIPISTLELALAAEAPDIPAFVEAAIWHVERRHGKVVAGGWQRDVLLKGEARLALRRLLAAAGADRSITAGARPTIVERKGGYDATLPAQTSSFLAAAGLLDDARRAVRKAGHAVGFDLRLNVGSPVAREAPARESLVNEIYWPGGAARILVVAIGSRAAVIARHISAPDWIPIPQAPELLRRWAVRRGREINGVEEASVVDVVEGARLPSLTEAYAAVVWLLDDGPLYDFGATGIIGSFLTRPDFDGQTVHLLAPALPLLTPSRVLAQTTLDERHVGPCHAVVDTSLARSPFWTGNPWRAIDRRIADVAVATALLCVMEGPVRAELLSNGSVKPPRMVSVALGRGDLDGPDPGLGLVSESSVTGLIEGDADRLDVTFGLTQLDKSVRKATHGFASLRLAEADFDVFARATVSAAIWPEMGSKRSEARKSWLEPVAVPAVGGAPRKLDGIGISAGMTIADGKRLVVTGEAPSLKAVRTAWAAGWSIVRYTDNETIEELLRNLEEGPLPRELRLPTMQRLPVNRGLAVRGVDPRDIVRLPAREAEDWIAQWKGSELASSARRYLARVDEKGPGELVFSRADLARSILNGDEAAVAASVAAGENPALLGDKPLKRPMDLRASWAAPAAGARRFVVDDGRIPAAVIELAPSAVPAQRMFLLDGDAAVPLLLSSRIFAIWARATTSRSTSWLSRFSVSRTFETLPIPPCFKLVTEGDARPRLHLAHDTVELDRIAHRFEKELSPERRWRRTRRSDRDGDEAEADWREVEASWHEVDRILLESIDLRPDVSDVEVLELLVSQSS
ncbi:hypothetical protein [Methylorubrum thiocyanatum]|uniref:hypothetical protein n=1 Tax=Methylorubrum thiocyanatum TaxID=47958 RepID=UPI0036501443